MPKTIASKLLEIFSGYQPNISGSKPLASNLDFEGSKIVSSLPVTLYPLWCNAKAKLCIADPPMAIKCTFIKQISNSKIQIPNYLWISYLVVKKCYAKALRRKGLMSRKSM